MSETRPPISAGPIGRALLLFAVPTLVGNILQSLNASINTIWIGRFLGEQALARLAAGGWLAPGATVVFERGATEPPFEAAGYEPLDVRDYGAARVSFLRFSETGGCS